MKEQILEVIIQNPINIYCLMG